MRLARSYAVQDCRSAPVHVPLRKDWFVMKNKTWSRWVFGGALITLVLVAVWDISVHRHVVNAQSSSPQPYERARYYTKATRTPFTFVSRYTLVGEHLDHTIRIEATEAEDLKGRILSARKQFNSASEETPLLETAQVIERPNGKVAALYWTSWQHTLGRPMFVTYGENKRFVPAHTLPEQNCVAPEPILKFSRYESLRIGGQDYPAAVVEIRDANLSETKTAWFSMTRDLGCLELKSVSEYVSPDHEKERLFTSLCP